VREKVFMEAFKRQRETRTATEANEARKHDFSESLKKPDEDRISMLSDGIFAIAVTLLVLGIEIPTGVNHEGFIKALNGDFFTNTMYYTITFVVLAGYWLNHRQLMNIVERVDGPFLRLNLLFLAFVAFFPVASNLLKFSQFPEAVIIYTVVLAGCGYSSLILWIYALEDHRLVAADMNINRSNMSRFISISVVPTFFLLSLLLLFFPAFSSSPSHVFYFWLILPFVNRIWGRIAKFLKQRKVAGA